MEAQVVRVLDCFRDNSILVSKNASQNLSPGSLITLDGKQFVVKTVSNGPQRVLLTICEPEEV